MYAGFVQHTDVTHTHTQYIYRYIIRIIIPEHKTQRAGAHARISNIIIQYILYFCLKHYLLKSNFSFK